MQRIILGYGFVSGAVVIGAAIFGIELAEVGRSLHFLELLGYLVMVVALSVIFVGIKRYRDQELGGVISFARAMTLGLAISFVASIVYVGVWEVYLALTDHAFIRDYTASIIAEQEAAGLGGEQLQALVAAMEVLRERYANPLTRLPITFIEIFPVGLLITLISAALLRRSSFMPA